MDTTPVSARLFGDSRVIDGFALVGGVVVGMGVWLAYPTLGEIYSLVPDHRIDWLLLAVFFGLPAFIAVRDGGLLACWWVDFPSLLAIYLLEFTVVGTAGGGSVGRVYSVGTVLPAIVVGAAVAVLWGSIGYGVGRAVRAGVRRVTSGDRHENSV